MKNLKKLVLSGAFVLAVVGAFAFQAVENSALQAVYTNVNGPCEEITSDCTFTNGEICNNEFLQPDCTSQAFRQ